MSGGFFRGTSADQDTRFYTKQAKLLKSQKFAPELDHTMVDGKTVQIQLTGFMEKHTGKFMKELWSILLSGQNNVNGVPQEFLDAKLEETRTKKAEMDRIAQEIQKRREEEEKEFHREKHIIKW